MTKHRAKSRHRRGTARLRRTVDEAREQRELFAADARAARVEQLLAVIAAQARKGTS